MEKTVTLRDLYHPIENALTEVRHTMNGLWHDVLRLVHAHVDEVPETGGKLLRPALCLLSAGAVGGKPARFVSMAASYEALHVASLAHDDVIDRAFTRRGAASLNSLWNDHAAVLGGDYMVARSIELLAEYDSCAIVIDALSTIRRMAEGELHFFERDRASIGEEDCLLLAESKTASLFAAACAAPARFSAPEYVEPLHGFGMNLGIAFQVVDDLLDVTQSSAQLGKPACSDVTEGKQTLPLLYLRQALPEKFRARLDALRGASLTDADRDWILHHVEDSGAGQRAVEQAHAHGQEALESLAALPQSDYRNAMENLVEFVQVRLS
jgi:geranylgeranyl pyrophosphate synthase